MKSMADNGYGEMVFVLLLMGVLTTRAAQNNFELNVAVLPQWKDIINPIMASKHLGSVPVNLNTFDLGKTRSEYDKVKKAIQNLKDHNIHAVVGPFDVPISLATESLNITYLAASEVKTRFTNSTFQMIPRLNDFSQALLDMVKRYGWSEVSIFFDDSKGISVVEKLLTDHELLIKSWRLNHNSDEKQVRDHLVHMRRIFMQRSIVFCQKGNVEILLETARSLAMLSTPYEWFFYDPGDELADIMNNFPDIHVNFTVFTMMPFNSTVPSEQYFRDSFNKTLARDSVAILQECVIQPIEKNSTESVRNSLLERMQSIEFKGKSGSIQFDESGKRVNLSILLTEISGYATQQIGMWYSNVSLFDNRLQISKRFGFGNISHPFPLVGRTARVVTILEKPFCMYKRDHKVRKGNDRFEGFAVDLIHEVATMLKFDYEIYLVHDGNFGSKMPDGSWNGMIGELLQGNATMSVAPLSINSEREAAVDFTKPFMTRYISVLMKVPRSETSYFEFLNPLHPTVWFCTLGAFVFVSIVLYILERIGTLDRKECPSISFKESFWFVFGSLLQGSTDSSPSTLPGRILTSSWWFFALILISSYTANLAAFLTVKKINTPIKTVTDLASQTKIKYGTVQSSGIMSFFKNTDIEHFSKMWAQMSEIEPSSMVKSTEEGFKKVKEELYAFFWDTTVNKYKTIENCDFMEVGPPFDPKGFGIGVPPGATYREELSMAILKLSDIGRLHELENRWWGRRNCPDHGKPSTDETSELQIDNVAGVFFILVGGVAVAAVVCLGEYFAKQISNSVKKAKNRNRQ
ncbi:glutamate receptor 1-like isoform X3 [Ruditapes philippinarum]|uniref:glutamate receptor 1-like isoform X3 n=1 Tax=Ruditapes philippinarum TaxID=129788 RepID=UPI00295BAFC1|nr:glutamate receptor 1-like isoform X3 [Ruditapes philippinarum]